MEPTKKSPEIQDLLDVVALQAFGRKRSETMGSEKCVMCGEDAKEFNDALSQKEYRISGLCQKCQDETFGDEPEPEDYEEDDSSLVYGPDE